MVVERIRLSAPVSGSRMGTAVDLLQVTDAHVGIALGGLQARMAKHLLDRAQVGAGVQQRRRETMAKAMRRKPLVDIRRHDTAREEVLHRSRSQAATAEICDNRSVGR